MASREVDDGSIQIHAERVTHEQGPLFGLERGISCAGSGKNGRDLPFDLGRRFPRDRSPLDREPAAGGVGRKLLAPLDERRMDRSRPSRG
jgi:hypothetical protein